MDMPLLGWWMRHFFGPTIGRKLLGSALNGFKMALFGNPTMRKYPKRTANTKIEMKQAKKKLASRTGNRTGDRQIQSLKP